MLYQMKYIPISVKNISNFFWSKQYYPQPMTHHFFYERGKFNHIFNLMNNLTHRNINILQKGPFAGCIKTSRNIDKINLLLDSTLEKEVIASTHDINTHGSVLNNLQCFSFGNLKDRVAEFALSFDIITANNKTISIKQPIFFDGIEHCYNNICMTLETPKLIIPPYHYTIYKIHAWLNKINIIINLLSICFILFYIIFFICKIKQKNLFMRIKRLLY